jgi:hypothetical protein
LLSIFGEHDTPTAVRQAQEAMRTALASAGDKDVTFVTLPRSSHNLLDSDSTNEGELPLSDHYTPSLYPITLKWLIARVHP